MLTPSGAQYLRPDYLTPLPTTLDAKKSPLALLAQTCSNIGADTPSTKSLLPSSQDKNSNKDSDKLRNNNSSSNSNNDKSCTPHQQQQQHSNNNSHHQQHSGDESSGGNHSHGRDSGNSNNANNRDRNDSTSGLNTSNNANRERSSSFKPYESVKKEAPDSIHDDKSGFRTPTSKSSSPAVSSAGSNSGKASPADLKTSAASDSSSSTTASISSSSINNPGSSPLHTSSLLHHHHNHAPTSHHQHPASAQHNRISIGCGNMFVEVNHHESGLPKDHLSSLGYKTGHGQLLPGLSHGGGAGGMLGSLSGCTGCTQVVSHIPMDSNGGQPSGYPPGMMGGGGGAGGMKHGYPGSAALSPYVAYARVKTATGGSTLVPICRDPFCTNCQLSVQNAQQLVGGGGGNGAGGAGPPSSCPSGCTQCNHEKAVAGMGGGHLSSLSLIPGLSPGGGPLSLGSGLYGGHHSMLTPRPYVCNWIAGDTYCGKRFTTSEELLQHLRTHTNLAAGGGAGDGSGMPMLNPSLSLPSPASLGGYHLHYSMAPSLTSPAGLHRTYPTSLSPVSSLSAASRYHPYKPQLGGLPGAPLTPFPPHPGLTAAQYFSPYAMYGQRLGAAVHP